MTQTVIEITKTSSSDHSNNGMADRPGYKWIKFIGWIPEEWPVKSIGSLTTKVGSGITPRGGEKAYVDEGIPIIRSQNVLRGRLDPEGVALITEEQHAEMSATQLQTGDVLLNITGASIGRSCVVPDWLEQGNVNQHVCILRPKDTLLPKYLSDLLNSRLGKHQIYSFQTGGSREGLTYAQIRAFEVPVPPLNEQKRIASTLREWDRHLAHLDALIEQKRTRLKGLRQRLLTGDVRFPEFDAPWQEVRLGSLFERRKDKSRNDLDLLAVTMDRGVIPRDKLDRRDTSNSDKSRYLLAKAGDVVYNSMRMWQGVCGVAPLDGIVSPAYTVCVPQEGIVVDFADELFHLPSVIDLFRRYSQGMVSDTLKLHFRNFAMIRIEIPPTLAEQRRIATVLQEAEREIDQLRALRAARARQKKGLMQRLLTGEVRV